MEPVPIDVATLPGAAPRDEIRVHFDRDCAEMRGDHFHRICPCGHRWVERCREDPTLLAAS